MFLREDGTKLLVVPRKKSLPVDVEQVLLRRAESPDGRKPKERWLKPEPSIITEGTARVWLDRPQQIRASWYEKFTFREEQRLNGQVVITGLRPPQIGALYAILAHWRASIEPEPATIVMPPVQVKLKRCSLPI